MEYISTNKILLKLFNKNSIDTQKKILKTINIQPSNADGIGWIYAFSSKKDNQILSNYWLKIGRTSRNPFHRVENEWGGVMLFCISTSYNRRLERLIHLFLDFTRKERFGICDKINNYNYKNKPIEQKDLIIENTSDTIILPIKSFCLIDKINNYKNKSIEQKDLIIENTSDTIILPIKNSGYQTFIKNIKNFFNKIFCHLQPSNVIITDISSNQIKSVDISSNQIKSVDISSNQIKSVDISSNQIKSVDIPIIKPIKTQIIIKEKKPLHREIEWFNFSEEINIPQIITEIWNLVENKYDGKVYYTK
jgi:hypothetical protein